MLSGTRDQHTTIEEARAIFAAAQPPKELWEVEGAGHVDLHSYAKEEYERRVAAFLGANLAAPVAYFSRESAAMKTQEAANR